MGRLEAPEKKGEHNTRTRQGEAIIYTGQTDKHAIFG
jgi:hypothetical protein